MNRLIRWKAHYANQRGVFVVAERHLQACRAEIFATYGRERVTVYWAEPTERPVTWQPPVKARQMTIWEVA